MKKYLLLLNLAFTSLLLNAQVFTNQIASSGLPVNKGFVHAVLDYNNDGYEDLIYSIPSGSNRYLTLYKNNGNTTFTNVTSSVGLPTNLLLSEAQGPIGILAADYNNDGLKDLVVWQPPSSIKIYKNNCGTTFTDVTTTLGISSPITNTSQITYFAVPSDFDKDGDLDFIISRTLSNNNRVVTAIKNNLNSNTFSLQDLFTVSSTNAFAAQIRAIDYDNDQDDDLLFMIQVPKPTYAASAGRFCLQTIKLYNNNFGVFSDNTSISGLDEAYIANGPVIFDYDNDGWLDVLYTSDDGYQSRWVDPNGASAITKFYRNIGKYTSGAIAFVDSSARNATDNLFPNTEAYYWFSSSMDFDNDADFDVFHGIGWCSITKHQLLKNNNNRFKDFAFSHSLDINANVCAGNGANVWFDVDKDGDLDVYINDFNGDSYLMINPLNTLQSKYLRIKLTGCASNKDARGAKVSVKLGSKYLTEFYGTSIGSNYNSSDIFHFGLGAASAADSVYVYWPSGAITKLGSTSANQLLNINESSCFSGQSLSFLIADSLKSCGDSTIIDAGIGYTTYTWSTGESTQSIYAKASGWYKVTVSNGVCTATDSVFVSLVKAKITANKTRICRGETVTLQADTTIGSLAACAKTELPTNLQNGLVAYYPFCGNANDASGNGNNGTVNGATLTTDRFGRPNGAYSFNGVNNSIQIPITNYINGKTFITISTWAKAKFGSIFGNWYYNPSIGSVGLMFSLNPQGFLGANLQHGLDITGTNFNEIDVWHLVVVTYDGTISTPQQRIKVYVDGQLQNLTFGYNHQPASTIGSQATDTYLGARQETPPSQLVGFLNGKIDDVGIWNRALTATEVQQLYSTSAPQAQTYAWNTGATSNAISVSPTVTTKYYLTVNNGTFSCKDSVTIVVDSLPNLPDTLKVCGDSILLNPGAFTNVSWNTGATSSTIYAKTTGWYKVTVTNPFCTASDSVYVSILKAKITANKTRICRGETVTLQADTTIGSLAACAKTDLPSNLQTGLVAYYPFCGNANDVSGNGYNGTVYGATLTKDRFGRANSAYSFNGVNNYIDIGNNINMPQFTLSGWINVSAFSGQQGIISKLRDWGTYQYKNFHLFVESNNRVGVHIGNGVSSPTVLSNNGVLSFNKWHHIIAIFNGTIGSVYLDGTLIGTCSNSNYVQTISSPTYIGARVEGAQNFINCFFNGLIDDVGIWNRALSATEIQQLYTAQTQTYSWTSNSGVQVLGTDSVLTISPTTTTTYTLTVGNGISTCSESVTIVVDTLKAPTLPDNLNACGDSVLLNPNSNGNYTWNTGETSATIYAKATGLYKVTITNGVCTATDSVNVSLVKAKITANKLKICKGESVKLSADNSVQFQKLCDKSGLPAGLQNGLVGYWPFCGNALDESGNNNHGTVNGATLTSDRFGNFSSAYSFDQLNQQSITGTLSNFNAQEFTVGVWGKHKTGITGNSPVNGFQPFEWLVSFGNPTAIAPTNEAFCIGVYNNTSNISSGGWGNLAVNGCNIDTLWKQYVVTFSQGQFKAYQNGILKGTTFGQLNISSYPFAFGRQLFNLNEFWNGALDDIGIWNRALSASEIQQLYTAQTQTYSWTSNVGAQVLGTDPILNVNPSTTTKYYLTVNNGISSCIDSVTIEVDEQPIPNLTDTLKVCGESVLLNSGNFAKKLWSTGDTTTTITATSSGLYKVNVTNTAGCSATDSVYVSLVKAKITTSKIRICRGETITLQADTTIGITACAKTDLPSNLQTGLVAYYPFCGNANDASGNGNNGTVNGATLTTDRFGKTNSAYSFNGSTASPSYISGDCSSFPTGNKTVSLWFFGNDIGVGVSGRSLFTYGGNTCGKSWLQLIDNLATGGNSYEVQGHCDNQKVSYNYGTNHPNGKWIHWLITTDILNGTKFYLDGVNVTSNPLFVNQTYVLGKIFIIGGAVSTSGLNFYWDVNTIPFNGKLDDIAIWNRALSAAEVQQLYISGKPTYSWSNGATGSSVSVTPTSTTKYYLTVNNGISTCIDSVTIQVDNITAPTLPDNLNACGDSVLLNPNSNGKFNWNTNDTTATIYAKATGLYKVTITNGVCSATDSVNVSLVKAKITASKIRICKGDTVTLSADSSLDISYNRNYCSTNDIPTQLRSGLIAFYPFCGNVNDISGNGNNGTNNGASYTTNRFGNSNNAGNFNGASKIDLPLNLNGALLNLTKFSLSAYVNLPAGPNNGQSIFSNWKAYPLTDPFGVNIGAGGKFLGFSNNAGTGVGTKNMIQTGQWVHVCTVFDGSKSSIYDRVNLYINGVKQLMDTGTFVYSPSVISNNLGNTATNTAIGAWMSQFGWIGYYNGLLDDIGIWNRVLTENEISALSKSASFSYNWTNNKNLLSNGTSSSIKVVPTATTKYILQVNNGTSICYDTITIEVDTIKAPAIPDNLNACGDSVLLNPNSNGNYTWNTGETTATIYAKATGLYKVTITNGVCTATDSVNVSLLKAKITASKLKICKGDNVKLSADNSVQFQKLCDKTGLPAGLQNGLVGYWPFCGNANDMSGNGNNGTVNGATLSTDRFGNVNNSYLFTNNINSKISIAHNNIFNFSNTFTVSYWFKLEAPWSYGVVNTIFKKLGYTNDGWSAGINQDNSTYGNGNYSIGFGCYPTSINSYPNLNTNFKYLNEWHLITTTYNSDSIRLYIDGIKINSTPFNLNIVNNTEPIIIGGTENLASSQSANRNIDDVSIWSRALSAIEIQQLFTAQTQTYSWTSNAGTQVLGTDSVLTVTPTNTTTYTLTVGNGISTCSESVTIQVDNIIAPTLPDNLNACGDSVLLNPKSSGTFTWNTGEKDTSIYAKATGLYKVTITNGVCTATDSVNVSLLKAKITASKLKICKGESVNLSADNSVQFQKLCDKTGLPAGLQNGLVGYWPFCGNANDMSGNGNNGTVNGATLTTDRFGRANSAYSFNGVNSVIDMPFGSNIQGNNARTVSSWFKMPELVQNYYCIYKGGTNGNGRDFTLQVNRIDNNHFTLYLRGYLSDVESSIFQLDSNKWYNFIVTYNGTNNSGVILYKDGVQVPMSAVNNSTFNTPQVLPQIGDYLDQYNVHNYFKGKLDDICIWNRALSASEIQQLYTAQTQTYSWTSNAGVQVLGTDSVLNVNPTTNTKYYLTVNNGTSSCIDSVTILVDSLPVPNLQDTLKVCGDSVLLNPGSFAKYSWGNGDTTTTLTAKASGMYKVTVSNAAGCSATDSVYVSLVKAKITASKTRICKGETVTLQADTTIGSLLACAKTDLPSNLQTGLVAYYPFCGNANDASGNGNNGTVNGASLTTDRFGRASSAYSFNGNSSYINVSNNSNLPNSSFTISIWFKTIYNGNKNYSSGLGRYLYAKGSDVCTFRGVINASPFSPPSNISQQAGLNGSYATCSDNYIDSIDLWHHLIFCYDGSSLKQYIDGRLKSNLTQNGTLQSNTGNLTIGCRLNGVLGDYFLGKLDDIGIWNRALTAAEIQQYYSSNASQTQTYAWNTAAISNVISVTPTTTTKYYLTVNNGISSCIDSVIIEVDTLKAPTLPDNLNACGDSVLLNPNSNGNYTWNTGETSATIYAKATGLYKVTITNGVCSATDSVNVSLLKAKITASKLKICKGDNVKLSADNSVQFQKLCDKTGLPAGLQNGLVGYWPFCGNANDASGNGHDGSIFGGVLPTKDRFGRLNSAYDFNGIDGFVSIANSTNMNYPSEFTISLWVNYTDDNSDHGIFTKHQTPIQNGFIVGAYNNKLRLWTNGTNMFSPLSYNDGNWHHVVFLYNGSSVKFYIDNILVLTQSVTYNSNNYPVNIGKVNGCCFYKGKVDDIVMYNRAISLSEIQQLFTAQTQTYSWTSNAGAQVLGTDSVLNVNPTTNTKYYLTVNNGTSSCVDSVTILVDTLKAPTLPDNLNACGDSVLLNPNSSGTFIWNTGEKDTSIYAKATGLYKVTITNGVCSATDSVNVSLLKAKITASKLKICKGDNVKLSADNSVQFQKLCDKSGLPAGLQNGLVGYWPFCGNANDASGNGNNGTVNGATLTTDRFGRASSAYSFNGVNNSIVVTNSNSLQTPNSIAVNFWIQFKGFGTQSPRMISKGWSPSGIEIHAETNSNHKIRYGGSSPISGGYGPISSSTLLNNNWYMVTAIDNKNTKLIYINGVLESTLNHNLGLIPVNLIDLVFGKNSQNNSDFLNGILDDIGIWNRALSATEIQQLYTAQTQTYSWTSNAGAQVLGTDSVLTITPTTTTTYTLTVGNGISTCSESVTIEVDNITAPTLPDNLNACGDSVLLNPKSSGTFIWNTGEKDTSIYAKATGLYKVTITNGVCSATDSVNVSLLKAKITASKLKICKGESVKLSADNSVQFQKLCDKSGLPAGLQNGLVGYWPFCGNANDASGNGNNGTVYGATLTTDRFGRANSAYSFKSINSSSIQVQTTNLNNFNKGVSVSIWANIKTSWNYSAEFLLHYNSINSTNGFLMGIDQNNSIYGVGNYMVYSELIKSPPPPFQSKFIIGDFTKINKWNNYTFTYDGDSMKYYVNGILKASTSCSYTIQNNPIFQIGNQIIGSSNSDKDLDDIGLWNRALSAIEIQQLYTAQTQTYSWTSNAGAQVLGTDSVLTITPTTTTTYTLTVGNGISTCSESVTIVVDPLPQANLPDTLKVCGTQAQLNATAGFTSYLWNKAGSSNSITIDSSGKYIVKVTDANGCINYDTTLVSVINAKIKADTIVLCMGNHVNLEALINSNQSTLYPNKLLWSTNEQSKIIQVSPLVQTTYTLTVSNGIAVCTDQVQLNVNSVSTEFFGKDTLFACADSFVVKAVDGLHNFKWKDDASTVQQIVIKKDAWVVLTAQNANNCIATDSVFVHFTNTNFTLSDTVVCAGAGAIKATAIETGGVFSGPHVLNNQFNVPSTGGMYSISYTINNGTCSKTTTKWIRVIQRKDPSFLASAVKLCKNDGPVQFTFTDATGLFYKDNSPFNSSSFVANQVGKFVFKYVVKAEFCRDSISQQIEVIERPNAKFNPAKLVACVGDPAIPLNPVVAGGIFSGEHIQQNSFIPTKAGKFKIVYTMSNDKCTDTSSLEIVVYNNPSGVIAYNPLAPLVNESINFSYNGTAVNTYLWNFGSTANPSTSNSASPSIQYESNGIVKVYLTVQNAEGCVSNLEATINIKDNSSLFVPNAFTPGVDGVNDMFYLVGEGISKLNFIIYNRWGEMIFESTDMNKAWDGKYGGQPCPAGVYYYILDATGTDKKIYQMNGTITLIR